MNVSSQPLGWRRQGGKCPRLPGRRLGPKPLTGSEAGTDPPAGPTIPLDGPRSNGHQDCAVPPGMTCWSRWGETCVTNTAVADYNCTNRHPFSVTCATRNGKAGGGRLPVGKGSWTAWAAE